MFGGLVRLNGVLNDMDVIRKRHRDMLERPQADAPVYRAILWVVLIRATPLLFLLILNSTNSCFGGKAAILKNTHFCDESGNYLMPGITGICIAVKPAGIDTFSLLIVAFEMLVRRVSSLISPFGANSFVCNGIP